jgi:hypothetical protein
MTQAPPSIVFIVPYRNRETQREFFDRHMRYILEDIPRESWEVLYIHQCDTRSFNRGAVKNIGFLVVKQKWPNDYANMTLVFNDVDIMPITKGLVNYPTQPGVVKHFYGFTHTLGGIVSIRGADFERTLGFPNFWAWGYEDNMFQFRVIKTNGMQVDRSKFYPLYDKNFIMLHDGTLREVNKGEFDEYARTTTEGYHSIRELVYTEDTTSFAAGSTVVNVSKFNTGREENIKTRRTHDLTQGSRPFSNKFGMIFK